MIQTKKGFKQLDFQYLNSNYQEMFKRLIIIDQEGVIPMKQIDGVSQPLPEAINLLHKISSDPKTQVFVVSQESKALMHSWYADRAPNLGIAAENGFFMRWNSK